MMLAVWGQQEQLAFKGGRPIEFLLHDSKPLQEGEEVLLNFFNAHGSISYETGIVVHAEPGLIKVERPKHATE